MEGEKMHGHFALRAEKTKLTLREREWQASRGGGLREEERGKPMDL